MYSKLKRERLLPGLELSNVRKDFGSTRVLDGVSLKIEPREFVAFLGPSGSGKSTLLRIIAGLENADSGTISLDDEIINDVAPGARGIAMVFQHYALYPHMTVRDNMAFGLRNARVPAVEIDQRVEEAAGVLEIAPLLDRKPGQLSGGQRQRVALGRAIIKRPKLFLLDEPLSNLDAALRTRTRIELAHLRERVDAAIIMVTHDQAEAMTLADRIVVINDRRIQQVGPPMEIYSRPANSFVARFVGSPAMTLAPVTLLDGGPNATVQLGEGTTIITKVPRDVLPAKALEVGLRPENLRVAALGDSAVAAKVELVERLGERTLVYARLGDGLPVIGEDIGTSAVRVGDEVGLRIDGLSAHLFGPDGVGYHASAAQ